MIVDRDQLEKALLINVIRAKNWNILILNNIDESYFTGKNKELYNYIKSYIQQKDAYPDIQLCCYDFKISEEELYDSLNIADLQEICESLKKEYIKSQIRYEVSGLNENSIEMEEHPIQYIDKIGEVYNKLKILGYTDKTVDMLDDLDHILTIDPHNVISTGFDDLDEKLIGWKRGEELAVFTARTGQGKSWMGLKFALAAALHNERVGIYSGEMSKEQMQERLLCCAKQDYTSTQEDALKYLKSKNVFLRLLTQKELRKRANVDDIEEMIIRDKLTMVVVDQLSLMEDKTAKPGTPLRQQYGNISMDLFSLSSRYNLPIILLVQSNRGAANNPGAPGLENIAESDAVGQNATRVISMKNENNILQMNIVKNRYGASGIASKYEVNFGINKWQPIQDTQIAQNKLIKRDKARSIFMGNGF